jgi:hypothetical protein
MRNFVVLKNNVRSRIRTSDSTTSCFQVAHLTVLPLNLVVTNRASSRL